MTTAQLSEGVIARMCDASLPATDPVWQTQPTLQVVQIKEIASNKAGSTASNRRRGLVSDGKNYAPVMFTTQLNEAIEKGELTKNTLIRVKSMTCNTMQEKRLIVLLEVEVIETLDHKIGEPKGVDKDGAAAANAGQEGKAESSASASRAAPPPAPVPAPAPLRPQQPAAPPTAARSGPTPPVYPIEGLSPYQNKWTIQARVTNKSEMKTWSNSKGDGKLFSCTFMDQTGEIRATAFNQAAEDLFNKLQENRVYYVSKARVSVAKKKFSNLPNEYEITMDRNTEIEEVVDDSMVPLQKYDFKSLNSLEALNKDDVCDVIGVVKDVGEKGTVETKITRRTLAKRDLTIVDQSGVAIRLTLWGKLAETFNHTDNPVVAFKGVKVGDYGGGRTLSLLSSGSMQVSPDLEESHRLRGWFDAKGKEVTFQTYSTGSSGGSSGGPIDRLEARFLHDIREINITPEKPEMFVTRAIIVHLKADDKMWYTACPVPTCGKKVTSTTDGFRCDACNRAHPEPSYRYMISLAVADGTSQCWLTAFNDAGLLILGMTGNDLHKLKEEDEGKFNTVAKKAVGKHYTFLCRGKTETYMDNTRTKYTISRLQPLDWKQEIDDLEKIILQY